MSLVLPLVVIGIFALFGALRGFLRVVSALLCLALASLLGVLVGPGVEPFLRGTGLPLSFQPVVALLLATVVVYAFLSAFAGMLIRRRERGRERRGLSRRGGLERAGGAVFGAGWGAILVLIALLGLEVVGGVQEAIAGPSSSSLRLPEDSPLASIVRSVSPVEQEDIEALAELPELVADPEALQNLRQAPEVQGLLEHPLILQATEDPEIRAAIERRDIAALLNNPTLAALARDPELRRQILELDATRLMREARGQLPAESP